MARKPTTATPRLPPRTASNRDRIIEGFLALLAEKPIEDIGFGAIAERSGVSLAECRAEFGSVMAVLAGHMKDIDRKVLASDDGDMGEESPRERLFDVLMRRFELLAPHRPAIRSLMRSACRNPGLALALNGFAARSQAWMLNAAGIDTAGLKGAIRAQGLTLLYARVTRVWLQDDDPGLARTLAALDRELARGQRWVGFLNDLCRFVPRCPPGRSRRRRYDPYDREAGDEPAAA